MDREQLFKGAKYYNEHYSHWVSSYSKLRERGDEYWLHLERLSENQLRDEVIGFLNDWLCRVDKQSSTSLKQILSNTAPLYEALRNEVIETIDFNESKTVTNQQLSNSDIIKRIMAHFLSVTPKFGSVAASKLMHMASPNLFIMWDTGIKARYRIPTYHVANHASNYVRFLELMQVNIRHAIDSYAKAYGVSAQSAFEQVRKEDNHSTLPRVVDKYNFAIRDGQLRICAECYNQWMR